MKDPLDMKCEERGKASIGDRFTMRLVLVAPTTRAFEKAAMVRVDIALCCLI